MELLDGLALSPHQLRVALNALELAAEHYKKDGATVRAAGYQRVADQFALQAKEALELAALIEESFWA